MNEYIISLIIGIVAGISAVLILRYLSSIRKYFKNIKIIKGLQVKESGITGIWKDRHQKESIKAVKEALQKANGEILMAGVAFPDFFRPKCEYSSEISTLLKKSSFTFRILFLNPDKDHAKERAEIERGRFTIMDIENTIDFLKLVNAQFNIRVHLYDFPPMAFLIITNDCIFVEQYHFGAPRVDLGCTGGQTIFIRLDRNSHTYKVMKQHFEYIWNKKSNEIINRSQQ